MKLSRNFTNYFNWTLDNVIPPIIRDSRFFSAPLFWSLFGKKAKLFMEFKEKVPVCDEQQIRDYYKRLAEVHIKRDTDLNKESADFILNNIVGENILDIASGRGYLCKEIVKKYNCKVVGIDFIVNDEMKKSVNPLFIEADILQIPYPDNHFDTVICTHTLEHVVNLQQAVSELRRVCKQKLIVVVPKQREYKYTFDLHVHFFPYRFSILNVFNNRNGQCTCIKNDWVYYETK